MDKHIKYSNNLPKNVKFTRSLVEKIKYNKGDKFYKTWLFPFNIEKVDEYQMSNSKFSVQISQAFREVDSSLHLPERYRLPTKVLVTPFNGIFSSITLKMPLALGDFKTLLRNCQSQHVSLVKDLLIQILLLIRGMYKGYNVSHNDLYPRNIVILKIKHKKFSAYINNKKVSVKTHGMRVSFVDFEYASQGSELHNQILGNLVINPSHALWVQRDRPDLRDVYAVLHGMLIGSNCKGIKRLAGKSMNIIKREKSLDSLLTYLLPPF